MRGHLGFLPQRCHVPFPPTNLAIASTNSNDNTVTLSWSAPQPGGVRAPLRYWVETISDDNLPDTQLIQEWMALSRPATIDDALGRWVPYFDEPVVYTDTAFDAYNSGEVTVARPCRGGLFFRVRPENLCGAGYPSSYVIVASEPAPPSAVLVTTSTQLTVPCGVDTIKAFCIGRGGSSVVADYGGGGGGLAWKTWYAWAPGSAIVCTIQNNYVGNDAPRTSVTFDGATFYARHAEGQQSAGYGGDADGGEYGAPGGESSYRYLTQYSFISGASQYAYVPGTQPEDHRYYFFGGGIGGGDPLPPGAPSFWVDAGLKIYPYPSSPCMRHPAHDRSGLLAAAALAGLRVTESCAGDAAIGSGASKWPLVGTTSPYGGYQWQYNAAGYGGGGFADGHIPGGPACIIIGYNL